MQRPEDFRPLTCNPDLRLYSPRLELRPLRMDDCGPRYLAWLENPAIHAWLETRWQPQSLDSIRSFVAAINDDPCSLLFGMLRAADQRHIGNIKLGPINPIHSCADISYFIGERDAWGQGFATEAIRAVVDFAFQHLALHRVQAGCYADNVGSMRALEKVGFQREGVWRQQLRVDAADTSSWQDHLWFGILADEWPRAQSGQQGPQ
ncbi:MAG: N-acetyltransferase [Planctomycetota bacterium]|nr:MAG: N-acetyltransferase [Planctomycetota bacterium]